MNLNQNMERDATWTDPSILKHSRGSKRAATLRRISLDELYQALAFSHQDPRRPRAKPYLIRNSMRNPEDFEGLVWAENTGLLLPAGCAVEKTSEYMPFLLNFRPHMELANLDEHVPVLSGEIFIINKHLDVCIDLVSLSIHIIW